MQIAVIGAGALGSQYAALLSLAGEDVTLVGNAGARPHLDAIVRHGLEISVAPGVLERWEYSEKQSFYRVTNFAVTDDPARYAGSADLALVLVKSFRTDAAAEQAAVLLKPDGLCLTLQNGLGNAEILQARLGAARVRQGITAIGVTKTGDGQIQWLGVGTTALGDDHPLLVEFAGLLQNLQLPLVVSPNVAGLVWGKLIANAALNPVTALLNVKNGVLLENPDALALVRALADETARIAVAAGIKLPFEPEKAFDHALQIASANAANTSSMCADMQHGRQTEIEAINGAVWRKATELGLPAPYNEAIYRLVRAKTP
jgi:2-dehydropantoate 2-reductase